MIKKIEPEEDQEELRKEALSRQDALSYLEQCILQGITFPEDEDLLQRGQAEQEYQIKRQRTYELERQTEEISQNHLLIHFLKETRGYDLGEVSKIGEKREILTRHFIKFGEDGEQNIKNYDQVQIRDLFKSVVLSYRKKYDLWFENLEVKILKKFSEEAEQFKDEPALSDKEIKKAILRKYFPNEANYEKLDGVGTETLFTIKIEEAEKLYLLKYNALQYRV